MKNQQGGFLIGMVVGLLIGLALALGVALYITKAPVPFINKVPQRTAEQDAAEAVKNRNWDPNAPLAGKAAARAAAAAASSVVDNSPPAPVAPAGVAHSAASAAPAAARGQRDGAAVSSGQAASAARSAAVGADAFSYYVQAGAYARTEDADQQRAKLAMLGMTAKVMEREQSGHTVYRVRIGPFETRDEAEATQSRLAAASVAANLVRVER